MSHGSLENYYKSAFTLTHIHKMFSLTEYENMIPFEKDLYVSLLTEHIELQKEQMLQEQAKQEALSRRRF